MFDFTDMSKIYSIELSNGRTLNNVHLNGNNFYTTYKIDEDMFDGGLKKVVVSDGETEQVGENMRLLQLVHYDSSLGLEAGWYFVFGQIPEEEMRFAKLQSDIEYLSMMTDIEI